MKKKEPAVRPEQFTDTAQNEYHAEDLAKLESLIKIGFTRAATFTVVDNEIQVDFVDDSIAKAKNVLYAMVVANEIKYIGKSIRTLRQRMQGYKTPAASQLTNVKVKARILGLGEPRVDIYALPDNGLLHFGGFHLNLAAGLEDSLIKQIQPDWNGGKKLFEEIGSEVPVESEG